MIEVMRERDIFDIKINIYLSKTISRQNLQKIDKEFSQLFFHRNIRKK